MFHQKNFGILAQEVQSMWNIPAISYGLIINGKLSEIHAIGGASQNTLFKIGSNGKSITGAMLLHELKKQDLNIYSKLIDVNKNIKFSDEQYANQIQIKDILTHSTGHGKFTCCMMAYLGYSSDDIIRSFQYIPFLKSPGYSFQYQNGLYLLAGRLLEYLSGMRSSIYFKKYLYEPLAMHDTYMGLSETPVTQLAKPYTEVNGCNESMKQSSFSDAIGTGGNINTTAFDLSQWILANLQAIRSCKESLFEKQIFPYVAFKQDLNPTFCLNELIQWKGYGLGWYLNSFKHQLVVEHLGGVPGYTSFMSFCPVLNAGLVLLCNKTDMRYPLEYLRMAFYSLLMNQDVSLSISNLYSQTLEYQTLLKKRLFYRKRSLPNRLKNIKLKFYNAQYGQIIFNTKNNMPEIYFETTKYSIPLACRGENVWIAEDQQHNFNTFLRRVSFRLTCDQKQISMQIDMDNQQGDLNPVEAQTFIAE